MDGTTHAFWLSALAAHAARRGVRARDLGLDVASLADPMAPVPLTALYDALERLADHLGDPDLGLALGRETDERALGAMAFLSFTAGSLGESLRQFEQFVPRGGERIEIALESGVAQLRFHPFGPPRPAHAIRAASFVADLVLNVIPMAAAEVTGLEARLRDPSRAAALSAALSIPVSGGAAVDTLSLDAAALSAPMRGRDPAMNAFFEDYLRDKSPPSGEGAAARVSQLVDGRLPDGALDAASLARALGWSARTLQRRLRAEGTHLRAVVAERRLIRARAALDAGRTMSEAAFEAGYSEASALHRALRRAHAR